MTKLDEAHGSTSSPQVICGEVSTSIVLKLCLVHHGEHSVPQVLHLTPACVALLSMSPC